MKAHLLVLTSLGLFCQLATATLVTVDSKCGPWDPGINPGFTYGDGSQSAPTAVAVTGGTSIQIWGASGAVWAGGGFDVVGPDGYTTGWASVFKNDAYGNSGKLFPSKYMSADWDTYLMALVGCFANSGGTVVGTPFEVGTQSLTLAVPVGATQLFLGVNDDIFGDNGGSFTVNVTPVPEPTTWLAGSLALLALVGPMVRRKH